MSTESGLTRRWVYGVIVAAAVVAALLGISNGRILGITPVVTPPSAATGALQNPVDVQPAPTLFKDQDLLPVESLLPLQSRRADANISDFYSAQPTGGAVDDAAFVDWASGQVEAEPTAGQRLAERSRISAVSRSTKKDLSARWLGLHGCRDVWTSYLLEQRRFLAEDTPVAKTADLTTLLDLAARVAAAAQAQFASGDAGHAQAPCTPRSSAAGEECGCSFPSSAAAISAAARTYLSALQPMAAPQYRWMEKQVDMAAVYQGFELPSDVEAGAYLGYLAGRYFLASRGYADVSPTPATPTAARLG